MNLYGKFVGGENELQEKREVRYACKFCATPRAGHLFPGLAERLFRERAVGDSAINARQPGFTNQRMEVAHFREKWRQGVRAPQALGKDRLDAEGLRAYRNSVYHLGRSLDTGEKALEAAQSFVNAFDGRRVGEAQVTRRAEALARDQCNARLIEQQLGEFR